MRNPINHVAELKKTIHASKNCLYLNIIIISDQRFNQIIMRTFQRTKIGRQYICRYLKYYSLIPIYQWTIVLRLFQTKPIHKSTITYLLTDFQINSSQALINFDLRSVYEPPSYTSKFTHFALATLIKVKPMHATNNGQCACVWLLRIQRERWLVIFRARSVELSTFSGHE